MTWHEAYEKLRNGEISLMKFASEIGVEPYIAMEINKRDNLIRTLRTIVENLRIHHKYTALYNAFCADAITEEEFEKLSERYILKDVKNPLDPHPSDPEIGPGDAPRCRQWDATDAY